MDCHAKPNPAARAGFAHPANDILVRTDLTEFHRVSRVLTIEVVMMIGERDEIFGPRRLI